MQEFIKGKAMTSLNESSSENSRALEKLRDGIAGTTSELSVAESRLDQVKKKIVALRVCQRRIFARRIATQSYRVSIVI